VPSELPCTAANTVVSRRAQIRVAGQPLFAVGGIVGFKNVLIDSDPSWPGAAPNFQITSDTGSNGPITYGQNVNPPGFPPYQCFLGPSGTAPVGCTVNRAPAPLSAPSVDTLPFAATAAANSNGSIGVGATYTAATRTLVVTGALVLTAGDYNLCSVTVNNGASIKSAAAAKVRIFVDSNARAASGCTASQGTFNAGSTSAQDTLLDGTTGSLEMYVYGTSAPPVMAPPPPTTCNNDFDYYHGTTVASTNVYIFAPNSNVRVWQNASMTGSMVGCTVYFRALSSSARFDAPPSGSRPTSNFGAEAGTWRQCQGTFAATADPESRCSG
jgi:hypothetical protein